jgi:hypothetical protein
VGWSLDGREVVLAREVPEGEIEYLGFNLASGQTRVLEGMIASPNGIGWQPLLVYPAP